MVVLHQQYALAFAGPFCEANTPAQQHPSNPTGQSPAVYRDKKLGIRYVKTAGGNTVAMGSDSKGRVFFLDKAGDLFYDTGNKNLGYYVVWPLPCLA